MLYILAQIIGFIAFFVSLIAYHRKDKKTILINMITANIINLVHYLLLGAYSGCITKLLAIFRDCFIIFKKNCNNFLNYFYLIFFIILYIIASIFTFNGILSILPLLAALIYTIFIWNGNELRLKKIAFICYFIWLIYNIFVMSISGIVSNVISIVSTLIAIENEKRRCKLYE